MGRRGPPPEPTALKLERGNPGRRPLNQEEPELAPGARKVPKGLTGRAKVEWNRLIGELLDKGLLTVGDLHAFERYCVLVGRLEEYETLVSSVGVEESHAKGYANYLLKLETQCRQAAAHLGLTPSSRSGVKAAKVIAPKSAAETKRQRYFGAEKPAS